jgi:hypothetical protein
MARLLAFASLVCASALASADDTGDGFRSIFDGRTLSGWWAGAPRYWTVVDGAITGRITNENPCETNQYLVWRGGELADFELKLESRLNGQGAINNGFQFRSRRLPDGDLCGYQMDNNLQTPWLVRLYDEYGRHTLAMRGERTRFDASGARMTEPLAEGAGDAWFRLEEWHEYHLTCVGPRILLRVDGRLAAEVIDDDLRRQELQGVLALQLHSGPPTEVQFRNIRLKMLKAAAPADEVAWAAADLPATVREHVIAWWSMAAGGHGAQPPLRHFPAFEQFELHVRPAGARAGRQTVVLLDGAYFESGELPRFDRHVTIYLRLRDPSGRWNAALCRIGAGSDPAPIQLDAIDLPGTTGPDIVFRVKTDQAQGTVSFPISAIDATAWHDFVARFDGVNLSLYCDGELRAQHACSGALVGTAGPALIAAERSADGQAVRQFRGELETVGLWSSALSEPQIRTLKAE